MYHTFIMLKPDASFTIDDLYSLVLDVIKSGESEAEHEGTYVRVSEGDGWLNLVWMNEAHVLEESNEIADRFGVPSRGCRARFEMFGEDPEMEVFNDYLLINERLQATGKFVIFDTQESKLLFDYAAGPAGLAGCLVLFQGDDPGDPVHIGDRGPAEFPWSSAALTQGRIDQPEFR